MKEAFDALLIWLLNVNPTNFALALTAVSCLATAIAALAAWRRVKKVSHANFARIFLSFSERYNAEEMAAALRTLVRWRQEQGDDFAKAWNAAYARGDATAAQVNCARRLVSRFYQDVGRLYDIGLINRKFARALLASNGLHVYYEICAPMNMEHDPDGFTGFDRHIRKIRRKYGAGKVRSTPPSNVEFLPADRAA